MAIHHSRVDLSIKRANGFDERRNSRNPAPDCAKGERKQAKRRTLAESVGREKVVREER